jgi:hypothetical protein
MVGDPELCSAARPTDSGLDSVIDGALRALITQLNPVESISAWCKPTLGDCRVETRSGPYSEEVGTPSILRSWSHSRWIQDMRKCCAQPHARPEHSGCRNAHLPMCTQFAFAQRVDQGLSIPFPPRINLVPTSWSSIRSVCTRVRGNESRGGLRRPVLFWAGSRVGKVAWSRPMHQTRD